MVIFPLIPEVDAQTAVSRVLGFLSVLETELAVWDLVLLRSQGDPSSTAQF